MLHHYIHIDVIFFAKHKNSSLIAFPNPSILPCFTNIPLSIILLTFILLIYLFILLSFLLFLSIYSSILPSFSQFIYSNILPYLFLFILLTFILSIYQSFYLSFSMWENMFPIWVTRDALSVKWPYRTFRHFRDSKRSNSYLMVEVGWWFGIVVN